MYFEYLKTIGVEIFVLKTCLFYSLKPPLLFNYNIIISFFRSMFRTSRNASKKKLIVIILMITSIYIYFTSNPQNSIYDTYTVYPRVFKSACDCHKNQTVVLKESQTDPTTIVVEFTLNGHSYQVPKSYLKYTNCDLYNTLKRGTNQKIIGYSLYGQDKKYYELIKG